VHPDEEQHCTNFSLIVAKFRPMRLTSILLGFLIFLSCKEKPKTDDRLSLLQGRWEVYQALRDDQETQTLAGTYFEFQTDGQMRTNLPVQAEEIAPFTLEKELIRQGGDVPVTYTLKSITATDLNLLLDLQGITFDMRLRKAAPAEEAAGDSTVVQ
jgi:hypothetical protein